MGILDRVSQSLARLAPETLNEFFALQLAKNLNDIGRVREHFRLVEQHPRELILAAFHAVAEAEPAERANQYLLKLQQIINDSQR